MDANPILKFFEYAHIGRNVGWSEKTLGGEGLLRQGGIAMIDKWIILLVAIGFGIARFLVPVTGGINHADIFKDAAHIVIGLMFGYAIGKHRRELWAIPSALTAVEVVAFIVRRS